MNLSSGKVKIFVLVISFIYINIYLIAFSFLQSYCEIEHDRLGNNVNKEVEDTNNIDKYYSKRNASNDPSINIIDQSSPTVSFICSVEIYPMIVGVYFGINDFVQFALCSFFIRTFVARVGCSRFLTRLVTLSSPLVFCWCLRYDIIPMLSFDLQNDDTSMMDNSIAMALTADHDDGYNPLLSLNYSKIIIAINMISNESIIPIEENTAEIVDVIPPFSFDRNGLIQIIMITITIVCISPFIRNLLILAKYCRQFLFSKIAIINRQSSSTIVTQQYLELFGRSLLFTDSFRLLFFIVWLSIAFFYSFLLFDIFYLITFKTPISMLDSSVIDIAALPMISLFCYFVLSAPHMSTPTKTYFISERNRRIRVTKFCCFDGQICLCRSLVEVDDDDDQQPLQPQPTDHIIDDYSKLPIWVRNKLFTDINTDVTPA